MILDQIGARLDRRGVGPPSVVAEQEDVGLEVTFALDGERLGGHVALLDRMGVGDERPRVERVGLDDFLLESEGRLHPLVEGDQPLLADESCRRLRQVRPFVEADAWVRHHHLRIFLEIRGDDDDRDVAGDRVEGQQQIAAHVEVQPSGRQQELVVGLRASLHDRDVEAVFGVSAVGDRLVISAVLGLGEPVGAE